MSTIKNGQISLYCHFNKIIKDARNVCNKRHQSLTKFYFDSTLDSKEISVSVTSYVAMPMMTSQISKSVHFTKIQKSRYLDNKAFFLK